MTTTLGCSWGCGYDYGNKHHKLGYHPQNYDTLVIYPLTTGTAPPKSWEIMGQSSAMTNGQYKL